MIEAIYLILVISVVIFIYTGVDVVHLLTGGDSKLGKFFSKLLKIVKHLALGIMALLFVIYILSLFLGES